MAAVTHVCSIDYVAKMLGEDAELLEAIISNDDNLTYGNIVSIYVGPDETNTALTDDGIEEVKEMIRAGAGAVHLEDQVAQKRCGHRPNKEIVSKAEMVDRIKAAADARTDQDFFIIARTDAFQKEGLDAAVDRARACLEAGADGIFAEAVHTLEDYKAFAEGLGGAPLLANITEFGATPLFTREELSDAGASMILYPLSAFRAMNQAALNVYRTIREEGTQKNVVDTMQTRMELYDFLGYHDYERKLDELFAQQRGE